MTNVEMLDRILWLHMTASLARQSVDVGHMPPPDQLALSCDAVTMTLDLLVAQMVEGDKIPRWELVERCTVIHKRILGAPSGFARREDPP